MSVACPDVTLVLPTRNRLGCLRRVLPTYLAQPLREAILVDDGSEPPLALADLELARGTPVRLLRLAEQRGAPAARNAGVREARTEWLLFSDDDVLLDPDYLARLLETRARTGADIVAGRRLYLEEGETPEAARARCARMPARLYDPRRFDANFAAPLTEDAEALHLQTTALVRRGVAVEIPFDEEYVPPSYREETDFFIRAAGAGHRLYFCSSAVCYHLPPSETVCGGQRRNRWWEYEIGVVRNNHRFLSRHWGYLRARNAIEGPRWLAEVRFADWRLRGGLVRALYRRYRASRLRGIVCRLRGRPVECGSRT